MPEIQLAQGKVEYRAEGSGDPLVLIHGLLVNGSVWNGVLPHLAPRHRCIIPDLPLGSHREAMDPDADLSPRGLAALIAELIARLELGPVTLVGNDTGGALCQLVCAYHPERIARLVLTNCDAFEHFPPSSFKPLITGLAHVPGALAMLGIMGRLAPIRRASMSLAALTTAPIPDATLAEWITPLRERAVRRDLLKVLRGIHPRHTLAAAGRLPEFDRPVLVAWGTEDLYFPVADARRLVATFPHARLELIEGARTFVQLDAPERLAALLDSASVAAPAGQEVA